MSWIDGLRHRLHVWRSAERYAAELAEERGFHQAMEAREAEAGAESQRSGGEPRPDGPASGSPLHDRVAQDLGYALRGLRRSPGFTAVVVTTLALGVGANAAVFSMLDRVFNQAPAGVRDPDELRRLYLEMPTRIEEDGLPRAFGFWSYSAYAAIESAADGAYRVASWIPSSDARLGEADSELTVRLSFVSHAYFDVLGVGTRQGRLFGLEEARVDARSPVAVISDDFWDRAFARDQSVVGRTVLIDGIAVTVVGVAAERFAGLELGSTDVFLPLGMFTGGRPQLGFAWYDEPGNYLQAVARLQSGVTDEPFSERATAGYLRRTPLPLGGDVIDSTQVVRAGSIVEARGLGRRVGTRDHAQAIAISTRMMGVSTILFLISCANMAGLLALRASRRRREIAVRIALGISRGRLAVQLLTEGLLLALLGGVVGGVVAGFGGRALRSLLLPEMRWAESIVEPRTLTFALATTAVTGLLVACAPLWQACGPASWVDLKAGTWGGPSRSILRSALIVAQVALSVVLVVGAGLFTRSLGNATGLRLGFDANEVAFVNGLTPLAGLGDARGAVTDLADALASAPGVIGVAMASTPPMQGFGTSRFFLRDSDTGDGRPPEVDATMASVSPGYFEVVGTRILEGRGFSEGDVSGVVVDETMALTYWPGRSALGQCLVFGRPDGPCRDVIGVAEDQRIARVIEPEATPRYFLPLQPTSTPRSIVLRVEPRRWSQVAGLARRAVAGRFNERTVRIGTMSEALEPQYRTWRVGARLFGIFGALALLITAVGIYGAVSYSVAMRRHELGVRLALGAQLADVLRLILTDGLRVVCLGAALGLVAALALGRPVEAFLYGVTPRDPATSLVAIGVLVAAGAAASLIPALRDGRVDPAEILRQD